MKQLLADVFLPAQVHVKAWTRLKVWASHSINPLMVLPAPVRVAHGQTAADGLAG